MRPTRLLLAAAAVTAVALLLWNQPEHPTSTSTPTPAASATTPPVTTLPRPTVSPAAPTPTALEVTSEPTATSTPDLEPVDRRPSHYEDVAVRFLEAFARPDARVTAGEWWARVEPMLTEQGAVDYAGTDPRNVPFTRVTGPARLVPSAAPAELLTVALVPTDGGTFRVEMSTGPDGVRVALAAQEGGQ
jgi:hypothetical protein